MNEQRLQALLTFLEEDPEDPFNWYAVAQEYMTHNPEKALYYFTQLTENQPEYVPTYYHLAKLYEDKEERELAEKYYEIGIEMATKKADHHALKELKSAYNNFLFDE